MDDIERCARAMGMKPHREVQEVVPVDGGHAARTHDGRWTLVRDDGTTQPTEAPLVVERDSGVVEDLPYRVEVGGEEVVVTPVVKPEPKRRGRS